MRWISICFITFVSFTSAVRAQDSVGIPVYKITPVESRIKFGVKASAPIERTFDKWNATLAFTSNNVSAGRLIIEIQADSIVGRKCQRSIDRKSTRLNSSHT